MADVVQIIFQFLDRVLVAFAVRIIYLRPSGDPRLHQVPKMVKRDGLLIALGALAPLGARTNQADVAFEGVPKLRQLIQAKFPQPPPYRGDAMIAFSGVNILHRTIRALPHRAEFKKNEASAIAANPFLPE